MKSTVAMSDISHNHPEYIKESAEYRTFPASALKGGALAKLAAIFGEQEEFRAFLNQRWADEAPFDTADKVAVLVCRVCEVNSRKEFDNDPDAAERFHDRIRIPYVNWQLGRR